MRKAFNLLLAMALSPFVVLVWLLYVSRLSDYRSASQVLSVVPDLLGGVYLRRFWYQTTLNCGPSLVVGWLSAIENDQAVIGARAYIGQRVSIGLATLGDDVLLGPGVTIVSGGQQHGMRLGPPINRQAGSGKVRVTLGSDVWIGAGVVICADVPEGCVVGMGAVVAAPLVDPYTIYAGNPARAIRARQP